MNRSLEPVAAWTDTCADFIKTIANAVITRSLGIVGLNHCRNRTETPIHRLPVSTSVALKRDLLLSTEWLVIIKQYKW